MAVPHTRGNKWKLSGAILIEAVLVIGLFLAVLFRAHLSLVRLGRERLENLQQKRLPYDGRVPISLRG